MVTVTKYNVHTTGLLSAITTRMCYDAAAVTPQIHPHLLTCILSICIITSFIEINIFQTRIHSKWPVTQLLPVIVFTVKNVLFFFFIFNLNTRCHCFITFYRKRSIGSHTQGDFSCNLHNTGSIRIKLSVKLNMWITPLRVCHQFFFACCASDSSCLRGT